MLRRMRGQEEEEEERRAGRGEVGRSAVPWRHRAGGHSWPAGRFPLWAAEKK